MDAYARPAPAPEPILLDVTRLVSLRWTGRQPNGIDRVSTEYLRHFGDRALAVVQHRGVIRVLARASSERLFHLLGDGGSSARMRMATLLASTLAAPAVCRSGGLYLNVSHTDFDLPAHARWVSRNGLKAVYLLHDLIPILHAEHCRLHAVARHTGRVNAALRQGSGIIVGSAAVARDLHDYAERNGSNVPPVVVSGLAGAALGDPVRPKTRQGDFFLCVGTIESRKNHLLLLRVWERLHARLGAATPRLVIVGRWGWGSEAFRNALDASGLAGGKIRVLDDCDDRTLSTLMADARAMLMPSLAEGFGLPMAEALTAGTPVIASDLPCFREIGRGVPCLLDPYDTAAWEERIVALDPAAARRQRRIDALHGYRPASWAQHFARVDPWLAHIVAHTGPVGRAALDGSSPFIAPQVRPSLDLEI